MPGRCNFLFVLGLGVLIIAVAVTLLEYSSVPVKIHSLVKTTSKLVEK
jgi:uncharacterized membrane protein